MKRGLDIYGQTKGEGDFNGILEADEKTKRRSGAWRLGEGTVGWGFEKTTKHRGEDVQSENYRNQPAAIINV